MSEKVFDDREVVAAINSCIDMKKLCDLPTKVVDRFKELVCKNKVKPVCFFRECGFGLRIFRDVYSGLVFDGGDEMDPNGDGEIKVNIDLNGAWIRCPVPVWDAAKAESEKATAWILTTRNGRRFIEDCPFVIPESLDNFDANDYSIQSYTWTSSRREAVKFTNHQLVTMIASALGLVILEAI